MRNTSFDIFERELERELHRYSKKMEHLYSYIELIIPKAKGMRIRLDFEDWKQWHSNASVEIAREARYRIEKYKSDNYTASLHFIFLNLKLKYPNNYRSFHWVCILKNGRILRYGKVEAGEEGQNSS